ncbi:MAG: CGNR zinc finger domain-containing protein [Actinomycetota bacterium]
MTGFVLVTGHPSLDLCNTHAGGVERLTRPGDLSEWLVAAGLARRRPDVTGEELEAVVRMRAALRAAFLVGDRAAVAESVAGLLDRARGRLSVDCGTLDWRFIPEGLTAACALVPVALDALCIARDAVDRVRECAADSCDVVYLDTSRNRSRRWCSMERCGARAKASAYYQRHRGEHPPAA